MRHTLFPLACVVLSLAPSAGVAENERGGDPLLPTVPAPLQAALFAREPLVRNPCAMAFDAQGRLYVGHGPQYRSPKPDTPPDSVVMLIDSDGDGVADTTKTFATGFNCIQGLAWKGKDLWVANSPDLTLVRDLDGDGEADEYVRVYTDLGNLEHALHGLNWAPDGKLYMSAGTSKGLSAAPDHAAPKPFRDLWAVEAPPGTPDFPQPRVFKKGEYQHTYQDPKDNWGREGGVLRAGELGAGLEIVSRGTRNVWDIAFDNEFNWLGTDNDQYDGDRIIMPFYGAHFGWGHSWSADWTGYNHLATAPVSGPVFTGSGTGLVYYDRPQLPAEYRGTWFINDWLRKTTFLYRPAWDGALTQPADGKWQEFARGRSALYQPVDICIGPEGALYLTGWGQSYGAVFKNGEQVNEGRIFRIFWPDAPEEVWNTPKRTKPISAWSDDELLADLGSALPVWNTNAQTELVRRGSQVVPALQTLLARADIAPAQFTWAIWTLGLSGPHDRSIDRWFATQGHLLSFNGLIQSIRIAGHRIREFQPKAELPSFVVDALAHAEPRVRFAAVQAIQQTRQPRWVPQLVSLAATESDRITFYALWQALRSLAGDAELKTLLNHADGGVRRAALLALLENDALGRDAVEPFVRDSDPATAQVAAQWIARLAGNPLVVIHPAPGEFSGKQKVKLLAGVKPGTLRWTRDGTEPTEPPPGERLREGINFELDATTTVKVALYVPASTDKKAHTYRKVGPTVTATWTKSGDETEPPIELETQTAPLTSADVVTRLKQADEQRGRRIFSAAGCIACHRVGDTGRTFGPDLTGMGDKADASHLIESMLDPNAIIAEGFGLLSLSTRDGQAYAGILKEETNRSLSLVQADGTPVSVDKALITEQTRLHQSVMPPFGYAMSAQQMADLTAWLLAQRSQALEQTLPSDGLPKSR